MERSGQLAVDGLTHLGLDQLRRLPLRRLEQTRAVVAVRVRPVPDLRRRVGLSH
jgi:hypothetical protein